jgi:transcriptional regulator with XRE-family HTH domain
VRVGSWARLCLTTGGFGAANTTSACGGELLVSAESADSPHTGLDEPAVAQYRVRNSRFNSTNVLRTGHSEISINIHTFGQMPELKDLPLGRAIRERRHELGLTQEQVARRVKVGGHHLGQIERGERHPSNKLVARLVKVLGFEGNLLFLLANPQARELLSDAAGAKAVQSSSWDLFRKNEPLKRLHRLTSVEMSILSDIASMGEVRSERDFICIINAIRQALGK